MQGIKKTFFILFSSFFILALHSGAQTYLIKGKVIDFETRDALAFVNIQVNDGSDGCISDIDGRFTMRSAVPVNKLRLSYIGYETQELILQPDGNELLIRMKKTGYELSEIVIKPGINPAHRIIEQVIANRSLNDHEHLPSFSYTSYDKMIFGPETDSIPDIDSLVADSSYRKAKEFFDKQHLFIMESVVKRSFRFPSDNYNKVIASRVSGLSDPLFVFLISQLQSTTFYKEVIKIVDRDYINPISKGCFTKYYFEIQDTIIEPYPYDTTFSISYRPLLNTNFDGLKGTVSISTNGFAIRNVIAIPARDEGMFSIKIQQLYSFIDSTHWFPSQLNSDIIFKNASIAVDTISIKIIGRGKSYISDVNLDPKLKRNQFGAYEVDVQPDAYLQPEMVWDNYRIDSLTPKEQKTYVVIDSIGKANKFDKMSKKLVALMEGKINLGYVDLYLDNLINVNRYEGFRTQLKLSTSDKVSSWFKIGGYGAYGFRDNKWKYGFDGTILFNRFSDFNLTARYYNDVDEAGADSRFRQSVKLFKPENYRNFLVNRMDHTTCYDASLSSRILKYMTLGAGFSVYNRYPLYDYTYTVVTSDNVTVTSSDFNFVEASLYMRYAFGEKFLKNAHSIISLGTKYPVLEFSALHGFDNILNGQYTYNRFDLKISKSFFIKYVGTTSVMLEAGWISKDIPYVNLYNARAAFYSNFTLYSPGSFSTMRMNEFTADRYTALYFSHSFGNLLFRSKYFSPEPSLVSNLGFGSLSNPQSNQGVEIQGYPNGYFESGLLIDRVLHFGITDLGIAWFYRYGSYSLPTPAENMAWKIAIRFVL